MNIANNKQYLSISEVIQQHTQKRDFYVWILSNLSSMYGSKINGNVYGIVLFHTREAIF